VSVDVSGNEDPSPSTVTWTVDTSAPAAPVITSVSPIVEGSPNVTVTGTGEPGSTITVYLDGLNVGTATTDSNGNWSVAIVAPTEPGDHVVAATSTDGADNASTQTTVTITVDGDAAQILLTYRGGGCGCQSGGEGAASFVGLLALLMVVTSRRRHRRTH
jgi:large repetitive protein